MFKTLAAFLPGFGHDIAPRAHCGICGSDMHDGRLHTAIPQDLADTLSGGYLASNVRNNDAWYGTLATLRHLATRLAHNRRERGVARTNKRNTGAQDSSWLKTTA